MPTCLTAVVAQSRPAFAERVVRLLTGDLGLEGAVIETSLEGAVATMIARPPDLAVIDRDWPGCDSLTVLSLVLDRLPRTYVLLTAGHFSKADVLRARNIGARGCVLESFPPDELLTAFRVVLAGGKVFPTDVMEFGSRDRPRSRYRRTVPRLIEDLTVRERQVLTYVGRGLTTKEIATVLNVSVKTAERHRTNLMTKMDIHDRVELALCAVREGLVRP